MKTRLEPKVWLESVLQNLESLDAESAAFIRTSRVRIGFYKQGPHTSAIWVPGKRIYLNPLYFSIQTEPRDARLQSVLIHEVRHLKQGFLTALSVYGELEAWQLGFRVYRQLTGLPYASNLLEFMSLPLSWDREVLRRAQVLMQVYAGKKYRADLLPLFPLGMELKFRLGKLKKQV